MEPGPVLPQSELSIRPNSDGSGGWPSAALFLIAAEFTERVAFFGVQGNLITYLTGPLGFSTAAAAAAVNAWAGTVSVLPLIGALAADSWFGRYRAVVAAGVLYLLSLGMLTVSSMLPPLHRHHAECHAASTSCSPPSASRVAVFYAALYLMALAQDFHRPCAQALGADQFDHQSDPDKRASRSSFFNWLHFSMSWGYTISVVALSYVQDNVGWAVGFGSSWTMMFVSFSVFVLGTRTYRFEQPSEGNPFARFTKMFITMARTRMASLIPRKEATDSRRFLISQEQRMVDGACHGDQENKGVLLRLLPFWMTSLVHAAVNAQVSTLFTKQSSTMERRIGSGGLVVPPAALQCFLSLTIIAFVPVYDSVLVPLARRVTKVPSGVTMLQRIGTGMTIACFAMLGGALVETKRLRTARDSGLLDRPDVTVPMSLWWMVPQYVLIGLADLFTIVGLEEFFYDQVPDTFRSVGLALCFSITGMGSYASGALVSVIDWVTRSGGECWFSDNLNRAHLDYFYWLLAGLSALEVITFLHFARGYVYRSKCILIQGP